MEHDRLLDLVSGALDEFDDRPLEVSARRAYRIARLRGDGEAALRLHMELKPVGGVREDEMGAVRSLYPEMTEEQARGKYADALEVFLKARTAARHAGAGGDDPVVMAGSIAELPHFYDTAATGTQLAAQAGEWTAEFEGVQKLADHREVVERIRTWVFGYLTRVECQLEASDTVSATLARHRTTVDRLLDRVVPDVRDQLQAALRTARSRGDSESRSQVLTTCRRVLTTIADHVYPASTSPHISGDGTARTVSAGAYRNRILAALEEGDTGGQAFAAALEDFACRLERLDSLSQKGVHASVSEHEMEFGLAQTYFLAGELIDRVGSAPAGSP